MWLSKLSVTGCFYFTFQFHIYNAIYRRNLESFFVVVENKIIMRSISIQTAHSDINYLILKKFQLNYGHLIYLFIWVSVHIFSFQFLVCLWTISLDPTTKPEDRGLKNYCDSTLARAAAWVCIAGIVFFVMPIFSGCCGGIFSACCSS